MLFNIGAIYDLFLTRRKLYCVLFPRTDNCSVSYGRQILCSADSIHIYFTGESNKINWNNYKSRDVYKTNRRTTFYYIKKLIVFWFFFRTVHKKASGVWTACRQIIYPLSNAYQNISFSECTWIWFQCTRSIKEKLNLCTSQLICCWQPQIYRSLGRYRSKGLNIIGA